MARVLLPVGIVLALVAALAATAGVLAYGNEPTRDGRLEVEGLPAPVTLAWSDRGHVWIEADAEAALAAGLGYAHAADHGWAVMLWRQAARGTLAEWFGDEARALDRHARALGLGAIGRETYAALSEADRALVDAYARGVNRAFEDPGVAQSDAFVASNVVPAPWDPWDALAVERLHVYLAAPGLSSDSTWRAARADSSVARFIEADSTFRAFLGMEGGGFDRAYALGSGGERVLVRQISAGSSALPLLTPAVLRLGEAGSVALTVPGTLTAPAGWSGGLGWGLLLGAPLTLEPFNGAAPPPVHDRIVERDGDETLLTVPRDSSGLVLRLPTPPSPRDTLVAPVDPSDVLPGAGLRVRWRGFRLGSDVGVFRALLRGRPPRAPVLWDGAGLAATTSDTRVLGAPLVAASGDGYAFVARSEQAREAVRLFSSSDTTGAQSPWSRDDLIDGAPSAWADEYRRTLLAAIGPRDSLPDVLQVPYSYLRSWRGGYAPDAIGPSIFEWWLVAHREFTGHLPDPADSLDAALLPSTLRIARAELRDRYGPLPSEWRWGALQGGPTFPVLGASDRVSARRYHAPLGPPGGHPTALRPGPSLAFEDERPGLAVWTVWTRLGDGLTSVRSPSLRPPPAGVISSPDRGAPLSLEPRGPLPERRLTLAP